MIKNLKAKALVLAVGALLGSAAMAQQINAKFAVTLPEKSHQGQGVAKFVEIVKQRSGGKINIKPFYNASLGNDVQVTSALQGGTIEFTVPATTTLAGLVKSFEVFDYPYLFANEKEAEAVLDGAVGKSVMGKLNDKGLVGLAYWENGFYHMTNSKHPINTVADFKGLKIRAIQAKVSLDTFKALGANPVPLAVPEIYTALETRTVDGQGTSLAVISALKLSEVQKYLSLTRHTYNAFMPIASKKFWDKLSEADRKLLVDAAVEAGKFQRQFTREQEAKIEKDLAAAGMKVNRVSDAELAKMRDAVKPLWATFAKEGDQATFDAVQAELAKLRK